MDQYIKQSIDARKNALSASYNLDAEMQNVVPTRAAVHQAAYDEVRKVPILGDAIDIGQKASYVGHLAKVFGGRKKKEK